MVQQSIHGSVLLTLTKVCVVWCVYVELAVGASKSLGNVAHVEVEVNCG